jgi:hypothetical protein
MKNKILKNKNGFALIFSLFVTVLLLAVVASISFIAIKQVTLSSTGRESQYAFYAANSGVECALYWDFQGLQVGDDLFAVFGTIDGGGNLIAPISSTLDPSYFVNCAGINLNEDGAGWVISNATNSYITNFQFEIVADTRTSCIKVDVQKTKNNSTGLVDTIISSRGYNVSCSNISSSNNRIVERGLRMVY